MTDAEKKEFLAVLIRDYGVQIGKEDEILPILHFMYQTTFEYKGMAARQEETIRGMQHTLQEMRAGIEVLSSQVHPKTVRSVPSAPEGALRIFGVNLRLRILILLNAVVLFLVFLAITGGLVYLAVRF